jgi:hypothetical protein
MQHGAEQGEDAQGPQGQATRHGASTPVTAARAREPFSPTVFAPLPMEPPPFLAAAGGQACSKKVSLLMCALPSCCDTHCGNSRQEQHPAACLPALTWRAVAPRRRPRFGAWGRRHLGPANDAAHHSVSAPSGMHMLQCSTSCCHTHGRTTQATTACTSSPSQPSPPLTWCLQRACGTPGALKPPPCVAGPAQLWSTRRAPVRAAGILRPSCRAAPCSSSSAACRA